MKYLKKYIFYDIRLQNNVQPVKRKEFHFGNKTKSQKNPKTKQKLKVYKKLLIQITL